jgi:thiol-disulfide isomerase/thioredoxin
MNETISVGPVVLATPTLLVLASWGIGWWTGDRLNRDDDRDLARLLTRAFVVALVAARAAYVVEWSGAYLAHPFDIADLRDGGWNLPVGLLLGWLYALAARPRTVRSARPVHLALMAGMLVFLGSTVVLHATSDADRRLALRDLQVTRLDGTPATLATPEGRTTVINLWATWCGPCRREMPMMAVAEAAHPDIDFVFVNQG